MWQKMQENLSWHMYRGEFTDEYKKTIGVDFLEKRQYVESVGEDVKLMVWDTAGQEEFDSITRTYYRGADSASAALLQPQHSAL
jgi:Ras-related protein Rab-23